MSVKQFETFLVEQFVEDAKAHMKAGFRYQFKSPDSENSVRLYQAMLVHSQDSISAGNGIELPFIQSSNCKIAFFVSTSFIAPFSLYISLQPILLLSSLPP